MADQRISLTKKQLETPDGAQLLKLCQAIKSDGKLSKQDIISLAHWLGANSTSEPPAVAYLIPILERIVSDKRVTSGEMQELHAAIEKVLPADARRELAGSRMAIEKAAADKQKELARANREAIKQAEREARRIQKDEEWERKRLEREGRPQGFHGKIAGVTRQNADGSDRQAIIRDHVKPGMQLIAKREANNSYDADAISLWIATRSLGIFAAERQVGYLQEHVCCDLAPYMDQGGWARITVKDVTGGGDRNYGVNIFIEDGREVL